MNSTILGQAANLISSTIGLILAGVFVTVVDKNFWKHWVTKTAFIVWCVRWLSYLLAYIWLLKKLPLVLLLPILDIGSVATLFFALILMSSDDNTHRSFWKASLPWLIGSASVLIIGTTVYAFADIVPARLRLLYMLTSIGPSEIIANIGTIAMGWAFVVRYRSLTSYFLLCLCLCYAFGQMPAYADVFVFGVLFDTTATELLRNPPWVFVVLAPMKVLIAIFSLCLFYTPFLASAQLSLPEQQADKPRWPPSADAIEAAPRLPNADAIPLPKNVRNILRASVVTIWAIVGLVVGIMKWGR